MSRKSNINMDHYKTMGRGRQGESVLHDDYKRSFAQTIVSNQGPLISFRKHNEQSNNHGAKFSRLERLKRSRKTRGLTPRQLLERKYSRRRTLINLNRPPGPSAAMALHEQGNS